MKISTLLIMLATTSLLAACATAPQHAHTSPPNYQSSTSPSNYGGGGSNVICAEVASHEMSSGERIPSYYRCDGFSSNSAEYRSGACTWVDAYTKRDGTLVSGHTRCASNVSLNYNRSTPLNNYRPASSNCHYVGGYTRKNGSYVRGHMRCR